MTGVGGLNSDGMMENLTMTELDRIWELLTTTSRRQQQAFGYHIADDGMPVWDGEDKPDFYTHESYQKEQMP